MSHVRTQIRQAAATALAAVAPVSVSRVYPIGDGELPILLVYTNDEQIEGATLGTYQRELDLVVEIVVKGSASDDVLDGLLVSVEQALNANRLGSLCKPLGPASLSVTFDASGSAPIGRYRLTYRARYYTTFANPEAAA